MSTLSAYEQGFAAGKTLHDDHQASVIDNPFTFDDPSFDEWEAGWLDGMEGRARWDRPQI